MSKKDRLILIGIISAAHGIRGHVLIRAFGADPQKLGNMDIVDKNTNSISCKTIRAHGKESLVATIGHCNNRNDAEALIGTELYLLRQALARLKTDEFYIADLINLAVQDLDGKTLGKVSNVFNFGAGDIIEISFAANGQKTMFPFKEEFFPKIEKDHLVLVPEPKLK